MTFREGDWYIYCDICGQRHYASETTKLSQYTGKDGLIVCKHDVDAIDYGLVPFTPRREKLVNNIRVSHNNTDNSSPFIDLESMTYRYYLVASQNNARIMTSQNDNKIIISRPI